MQVDETEAFSESDEVIDLEGSDSDPSPPVTHNLPLHDEPQATSDEPEIDQQRNKELHLWATKVSE